ncbi:MAG: hypothetical protein WEB57_12285 [Pseudohongiellaceae bacterium]
MNAHDVLTVLDTVPDARDGLTRTERIILYVLHETQKELNGRPVPSVMLYGRVCEYLDISEDEFRKRLAHLDPVGDRLR